MSKTGFRCKIVDWYDIHSGYTLTLRPGYTALVGPNGAGKTTLLRQLQENAEKRKYKTFFYSNLTDGGNNAMSASILRGNISFAATAMTSSEGERIAQCFGEKLGEIGRAVRDAIAEDVPLFILLDGLDSGASIDRLNDLMSVFSLIEKDAGVQPGGTEHEVYIVAAVNNYVLAKRACVDVRTGKHLSFADYMEYERFICGYFQKEGCHDEEDIHRG